MNKKTGLFVSTAFLLLLFLLPGYINKTIEYSSIQDYDLNESMNGKLTLNGSTSMTKLSSAISEEFSNLYPDIIVEKSDTGSSAAVTSVLNGVSLIGNVSRYLKESEVSEKLDFITIAFDGIAVIVNKDNPIENLSSADINNIFSGKINNWETFGFGKHPIILVGREESSGTRDSFEQAFSLDNTLCPYSVELPETGDIIAKVANDKFAIGYISISSLSDSVKPLKIDNVYPSKENIDNKIYKVYRPFNQIFLKASGEIPIVKAWFDFVFSEKGKQIIEKQKLIPAQLPDDLTTLG